MDKNDFENTRIYNELRDKGYSQNAAMVGVQAYNESKWTGNENYIDRVVKNSADNADYQFKYDY